MQPKVLYRKNSVFSGSLCWEALAKRGRRCDWSAWLAATLAWLVTLGVAGSTAQEAVPQAPAASQAPTAQPIAQDPWRLPDVGSSSAVVPVGCTECQGGFDVVGPTFSSSSVGCASCGGGCVPGRRPCHGCTARTRLGRFCCALYEAICCPDPCYDPHWLPLADAAFMVEAPRPQTHHRVRWDAGLRMVYPDRAEYFWARADGNGKGPAPQAPLIAIPRLSYHELSLYTEVASPKFGFFVDIPYREVEPTGAPHASGFGDMTLGTKTLVFDTELLQVSFVFRTHIPQADPRKGLGVGHVSLEPALLFALNLSPESYLQGEVAEWIPIVGNTDYQGSILHYHFSYNHTLFYPQPDSPVIGTFEVSCWSFQDGAYTDPARGTQPASNKTYVSIGPGVRYFICDTLDMGVGMIFSLDNEHFAEQLYRTEFRWRF